MSLLNYFPLTIIYLAVACTSSLSTLAARPSFPDINRKHAVYIGYAAGVSIAYTGLYHMWYKYNGFGNFRFYNDNNHWLQMDKAGHFTTSFQMGEYGISMLRWAGVDERQAILHGGVGGLVFLTGIEIFDGFSRGYGFSWGDQLANTAGAALLTSQELVWGEQRIRPKFSYFPTQYAGYRPELLGHNLLESWLKDYNGQTYWLSVSPGSFSEDNLFPEWLCLSFGYSAGGMTGSHTNPDFNGAGDPIPEFTRYRRYFLSLDIDLTKLEPESRFLQTVFSAIGFIKFPFSAMEFNKLDGFRFRPLYY